MHSITSAAPNSFPRPVYGWLLTMKQHTGSGASGAAGGANEI